VSKGDSASIHLCVRDEMLLQRDLWGDRKYNSFGVHNRMARVHPASHRSLAASASIIALASCYVRMLFLLFIGGSSCA